MGDKQSWSVTRRDFLRTTGAIAGAVGLAPALSAPFASKVLAKTKTLTRDGGHLYMQTNETRNAVVHYQRSANGTLIEVERVATGGAGSGLLSPIYPGRTTSRVRAVSFSRRIGGFCLRPMAATIPSPASP
jgi:TAT (twin-arginine translocation) pathway signal sequence